MLSSNTNLGGLGRGETVAWHVCESARYQSGCQGRHDDEAVKLEEHT